MYFCAVDDHVYQQPILNNVLLLCRQRSPTSALFQVLSLTSEINQNHSVKPQLFSFFFFKKFQSSENQHIGFDGWTLNNKLQSKYKKSPPCT